MRKRAFPGQLIHPEKSKGAPAAVTLGSCLLQEAAGTKPLKLLQQQPAVSGSRHSGCPSAFLPHLRRCSWLPQCQGARCVPGPCQPLGPPESQPSKQPAEQRLSLREGWQWPKLLTGRAGAPRVPHLGSQHGGLVPLSQITSSDQILFCCID